MSSLDHHHVHPANSRNPKPCVSYGIPFWEACTRHAKAFNSTRIYIVSSRSLSKSQALQDLKTSLGLFRIAGEYNGITQHTAWDQVFGLVHDLKETRADLIITLGGGSVTDGVKLARLLVANNIMALEQAESLLSRCEPGKPSDEGVKPASIPVINVPTTLSGAEFTRAAGATYTESNHKKRIIIHQSMYADFVVLDPELSLTTPARYWISTGIRAVDHFVEGIYGNMSMVRGDTSGSDQFIEKDIQASLADLLVALLQTVDDWHNHDARLRQLLALKDCPRAGHNGVGASHGIGHQLGPFGVGHGETSCIILPCVLKYNWSNGDARLRSKLQLIMDVFWGNAVLTKLLLLRGLRPQAADPGDVLAAYISALGMPNSLGKYGINQDKFHQIADNAMEDVCTQLNPVVLDKDRVVEILYMAA
ncbi:fumonisin cluster-dehydrogenase [Fusarium fujikuroi]|nr:fumonisin cluster-dehydrogenase [Fusarium fujikuroi]